MYGNHLYSSSEWQSPKHMFISMSFLLVFTAVGKCVLSTYCVFSSVIFLFYGLNMGTQRLSAVPKADLLSIFCTSLGVSTVS